jgi:hypothetical protein
MTPPATRRVSRALVLSRFWATVVTETLPAPTCGCSLTVTHTLPGAPLFASTHTGWPGDAVAAEAVGAAASMATAKPRPTASPIQRRADISTSPSEPRRSGYAASALGCPHNAYPLRLACQLLSRRLRSLPPRATFDAAGLCHVALDIPATHANRCCQADGVRSLSRRRLLVGQNARTWAFRSHGQAADMGVPFARSRR